MILSGVRNKNHVIASISRYDYRTYYSLMVDGGQAGCTGYGGYRRLKGEPCGFKVPQTFAELYNDYQFNSKKKRKYGVWKIKDIEILPHDEFPNRDSMDWISSHTMWGTYGKDGDQPLKYVSLKDCEEGHLKAILAETRNKEIEKVIKYILK